MEIRKWVLLAGLVPAALGASIFAACGGDDDDDSGGSSGGTGSDEAYVSDICAAGAKFAKDIDAASKNISSSDPAKIAESFAKPFSDFAKAFDKAKPPKDLADWHSQAEKQLNDAAKALKDGNTDADIFGESALPDPPKAAADRLQKIAEKNDDCKDANFDFSGS